MDAISPLADAWTPLVSSIFSTMSADPGRVTTHRRSPLRTSGCHRAITAPITPPLIPLQTEL
jgi:hypothetical protein